MIIAESIPVFNNLLGLIGALFASWFSYGLPGIFWLWMHYGNWFTDGKQTCRFLANVALLTTGFVMCVLGMWASIDSIIQTGTERKPWSCATNAAV